MKRCISNEYQSGCVDKIGSQCDKQTQRCVCKPDYTIKSGDYCLQPKFIGDNCFVSSQCNHMTPFAGCYNYREEFNQNPANFFGPNPDMWPTGVCRCKVGYHFDVTTNNCVKRIIGSWCSNVWDCRQEDKRLIIPYNCDKNVCECSSDYLYNQTTHDCHYKETYGIVCETREECTTPTICINRTCDCASDYHFDEKKSPKCQPNDNLNDVKSENSLDVAKGDKTFEIFILTVIPLVIIFLTIKPCLKKFGKCKPQTDEVIRGSKEISIKCTDYDKELALNQHKFCEKLQTIEEVGEETKLKDGEEEVIASEQVVVEKDNKREEDKTTADEKSIDSGMTKDSGVEETTISMECSANS